MSLINKRIRVCFAFLCCAAIVLYSGAAGFCYGAIDAEREVSLTILYKYENTVISGAAFNLYKAADVSAGAEFSVTEEFKDYSVALNNRTDTEWRAAAAAFAGYAARDEIEPVKSGKTDADGRLSFSGGMTAGLYLVIGNQRRLNKVTYTSEPFLICLPNIGADGEWEYDVSCSPKVSAAADNPKPSPTPKKSTSSGGKSSSGTVAGDVGTRQTSPPIPSGGTGSNSSGGTPSSDAPSGTTPSEGGSGGSGTPASGAPSGGTNSSGGTNPSGGTTPSSGTPSGGRGENPVTPGQMTDTVRALKVWRDDGNKAARPKSVEIQLLRNGAVYAEAVLNEENNWRYTWTDLDDSYMWQLVEKAVPNGYKVSVDTEGTTQMLINTYDPTPSTGTGGTVPGTIIPGGSIPGVPSNNGGGGGAPSGGGNPSSGGGGGASSSGGEKLPQTGQLWWPVSAMAAAGLFLLACGWTLNRRQD